MLCISAPVLLSSCEDTSTWGSHCLPNQSGHPSTSWRSYLDETNRTASSGKSRDESLTRGLPNQQTLLFSTFAPLTVTGHVPTDDAQRDSESRCVALSPPCPTTPNSIVILNSCLGFEPVSPSDGALRKTLIYRLHACGDTSKPYLSISSS